MSIVTLLTAGTDVSFFDEKVCYNECFLRYENYTNLLASGFGPPLPNPG